MKQRAPTCVRTGAFQSIRPSVTPSLYRYGGALTRRDPVSLGRVTGGLDAARVRRGRYDAEDHATHRQWVETTPERFGRLDELIDVASYTITSVVATGMTADAKTFPRDGLKEPGDVAAFGTTLPAFSNLASAAELAVSCRNDATM